MPLWGLKLRNKGGLLEGQSLGTVCSWDAGEHGACPEAAMRMLGVGDGQQTTEEEQEDVVRERLWSRVECPGTEASGPC